MWGWVSLSHFPQFGDPHGPGYTCFRIISLWHSTPSFSNLKVDYTGLFFSVAQQKKLLQFDRWSLFQFSVTDRRSTLGVCEMSPVKSRQKLSARDTGKKDKVVVEKVVEEELPPGWKVELKTRKGSNGKKRDWYYTDPVTGYIFRSLIDVQRYLKTGKVGRLAKKPKIAETDNKKVEGSESKEQLKVSTPMAETLSKSELPQRASKRLAGVAIDPPLPPPSPPEPKTRKATRSSTIKIDTPPPPPPPPPPPEPKTVEATRPAKTHVDPPPPPSSPPVPKEEAQTRPPVVLAIRKEKHNKPETQKTTNADMAVTQKLVKKSNKGKAKSDDTPATLPPVNHHSIPPPEKQPVNNPTQEPSSSITDFWTDPCIEFAVKTLTGGAIPFGDLNSKADRSALEVPMEELWTDPCIEFAVKTLTGAIPVSTLDMGMVFSKGNNGMQLDSVGHKSGNISFHQQVNGPRFF